ncbi:MAG TPA: glutamate--tRNA ligase family protein, partial [Thermodesulfobacteriota bacterium]|nr:glutamate--tRNA ligase family protein [Thermodesulfobacteriota bacterium]
RSDGAAAYNFAAVVDDHLMKVSHVIRGEDHLANTSRQVLVYDALGFPVPRFAHLSMILGPDRSPLSKRHGVTSISHFREEGYLAEGLCNYLALLGWSSETGREIFSREELIGDFSLARLSRSPAVFDPEKLKWVNRAHLKALSGEARIESAAPFLTRAGLDRDGLGRSRIPDALDLVWDEIDTLSQLAPRLKFLSDREWALAPEAETLLAREDSRKLIRIFREEIRSAEDINSENCDTILSGVAKKAGVSGRAFFMPLRALLTGATHGPELKKILVLLGREKTLKRADLVLRENG